MHQAAPKRTSYGIPNGSASANGHANSANGVPNGTHHPGGPVNGHANGSAHGHTNGSANGHALPNGMNHSQPLPSRKGGAPTPYLNQPNGYGPQAMSPPMSPTDGKFVQRHIPYSQPHQVYSRPPLLDQTLAERASPQPSSAAATPSPPPAPMGQSHSAQQNAQPRVLSKNPPARHGPMSPPTSPPQRATSSEALHPMSPPPQSFALPPGAGPAKAPNRSSRPNGVSTQHHVFQQAPSPPASYGGHQGNGHQRGPSAASAAQASLQRVTSPPSSHGHSISHQSSYSQANGPYVPNGIAQSQQHQQSGMATRPARSTSVSKGSATVQATAPPPPLPDAAEGRRWSSRPGAAQPNGSAAGMTTSTGARVEIVDSDQYPHTLQPSSGASVSVIATSRPQSARQPSAENYGSRGVASPPLVPVPAPAPAVAPSTVPAPALANPVHAQHPRPPEKPERSAQRSLPHPSQTSSRPTTGTASAQAGNTPIISPTPKSAAIPRPTIVIPQTSPNPPPPKPTPYEPSPVTTANAAPAPAPSMTTISAKPPPAVHQQPNYPSNVAQNFSRAMGSQISSGQGQDGVASSSAGRGQPNGYPNGNANGYANGYPSQIGNGLPGALKGVPAGVRTSNPATARRIVSSPLASPVNQTAPNNTIPMPRPYARSASGPSTSTQSSTSSQNSTESSKEKDRAKNRQSIMSRHRPARRNDKSLTYLLSHPRVVISLLPFLNINQFLNLLASDNDLRKYISGEMVGRWVMREWGVTLEKDRNRSWPGLTVWEGFRKLSDEE